MTGSDPRAGREAARLVAAAQEWLRTSAPHLAPAGPDGEQCSCPVCRAVAGVREADPDAVGRWVDIVVATLGTLREQAEDVLATFTADQGDDAAKREAQAEAAPGVSASAAADHASGAPAEADDTSLRQHPREDSARQDGPGSRAVRRIPITRDEGVGES